MRLEKTSCLYILYSTVTACIAIIEKYTRTVYVCILLCLSVRYTLASAVPVLYYVYCIRFAYCCFNLENFTRSSLFQGPRRAGTGFGILKYAARVCYDKDFGFFFSPSSGPDRTENLRRKSQLRRAYITYLLYGRARARVRSITVVAIAPPPPECCGMGACPLHVQFRRGSVSVYTSTYIIHSTRADT